LGLAPFFLAFSKRLIVEKLFTELMPVQKIPECVKAIGDFTARAGDGIMCG